MSEDPSPGSDRPSQQGRAGKGTKGGRSRPRARLVCTTCRQRKVKCDAEKIPQNTKCSPCQATNSQCIVNRNGDRRRHGASHQRMIEMQERIQSLESVVKQNAQPERRFTMDSAQPPPSNLDSPSAPFARRHSLALPSHPGRIDASPVPLEQGRNIGGLNVGISGVQHSDSLPSLWQPENSRLPIDQGVNSTDSEAIGRLRVPDFSGGHSEDVTVQAFGPSMGLNSLFKDGIPTPNTEEPPPQIDADEEGGELRFFGSTTQPHIRSPLEDTVVVGDDEDLETDLSLNMDSVQLQKALLATFFKVQPHAQIVVEEHLFMSHRDLRKRSRYWSAFLEDAILAAASRHSTSSAVRALGKSYAERAKTQIGLELEQPNIASLQGFLILSDFEATRGRARIGWTYSVIATGLMVDLALHVDCSNLVKENKLSASEANFRDGLLLSTFVYATLWSLYLGRPNSISLSVLCAVRRVASSATNVDTLHVWVGLCTKMLEIIDILNGPSSLGSLNRNTLLRLWELDSELRTFFNTLPPHLTLEDSRIEELDPNAYGLQMQFCGIQITLHLTMIKSEHLSQETGGVDSGQRSRAAVQLLTIVHENAVRIARLVLSYRRIFGLESMMTVMLDNMFVASIALTSHILRLQRHGKSAEKDIRWLRLLFETLEAVGKHYAVTARMRSSLTRMLANTSLAHLFPSKTVPSPGSVPESMTGLANTSAAPIGFSNAAAMGTVPNDTSFSNLDFTLTDDDSIWLHESAWNMASWSVHPVD